MNKSAVNKRVNILRYINHRKIASKQVVCEIQAEFLRCVEHKGKSQVVCVTLNRGRNGRKD